MKRLSTLIILSIIFDYTYAQVNYTHINLKDSLQKIENSKDANEKVSVLYNIGINYAYYKGDSGLLFLKKAETVAISNNLKNRLPLILFYQSNCSSNTLANYPAALFYAFNMLKSVNELNKSNPEYELFLDFAYYAIANSYAFLLNKPKSEEYFNKCTELFSKLEKSQTTSQNLSTFGVFAELCIRNKNLTLAKTFNEKAIAINDAFNFQDRWGVPYISKGKIFQKENKYEDAILYFKKSIPHSIIRNVLKDQSEAYMGIAESYYTLHQYDSSLAYCNKIIENAKIITFNEGLQKTYQIMFEIYKIKKVQDSAYKYIVKYNDIRDIIYNNLKLNEAQNMAMNEELKQRELAETKAKQQRILIVTAIFLVLVAVGIYFNGKRKEKERLRKIEEQRKSNELQAARDLQQSMLPKELPQRADLDIATFIRSSTEVGGDYYDFFPQQDGSIYSVCGDATGHGVTSGMMVSVTKAGLNGISPVKPNKILQRLNGVVKRIDLGTLRMSLNIAEITENEVFISSSAMPPIYLYKASNRTIHEFMNNGLPLGGLKDEEFALESFSFEKGDVLVQLSDGLPEAPNKVGEPFDYDQLKGLIKASSHLTAQQIIDILIQSVDKWLDGLHNPDDITLVVTKKI